MDPASLVSQVPEMWQFPMGGVSPTSLNRIGRMRGNASAESTLTEQSSVGKVAAGRRKKRDFSAAGLSENESSKPASDNSGNDMTGTETKCPKVVKCTDENNSVKSEAEASSGICNKLSDQNSQLTEPPKQDYIHVRARRGQATDSHSLAERARREKISERMKILQDLVPGCNKVIGKASVLDEIINYIQALQRQVEFLSMKLEAVNSRMNPGIEVIPPKDFGSETYDTASSLAFTSQAARECEQGPATEWLHMQLGGAFERVS